MGGRRVAVVGASGRMGSVTCAAVEAADDMELVARIDRDDALDDALAAGADVAVEFSTPATVRDHTIWLLDHGVHVVVGASGLDDDDLTMIDGATGDGHCIVAPNFAIGAVLMMRAAELVAAHLPHVEVIEAHHDRKVDAPSGTALRTAARVAAARGRDVAVPGPADHPARGRMVDGVPVHSVRLPGLVASQSVVFGAQGQTLTIRHDSIDRGSFMPGVLLAVRAVADRPGLTVGLDALL
jgi:4-hydroxy-tetrahydrodipicolinate reductase